MFVMHNPKIFLLNLLIFVFLILGLYFEARIVYLFCLVGLFLNSFLWLNSFSHRNRTDQADKVIRTEPDLTEKNMIMEDLDREAARRREEEQINKN